ncbi:MAG: hypothetical protein QFF03_10900 [Pseudomonadota bacterium]|nr:hypothetical protein [Pseudomonadota bacterium]
MDILDQHVAAAVELHEVRPQRRLTEKSGTPMAGMSNGALRQGRRQLGTAGQPRQRQAGQHELPARVCMVGHVIS